MRAGLLFVAALFAGATGVQAQTGITGVDVPISKVVVNPCSGGGFELVNGTVRITIVAGPITGGYQFQVGFASSGTGQDVQSNGMPVLNPKPDYAYSGTISSSATFASVPASLTLTVPITDWLWRIDGTSSDMLQMNVLLSIPFTSGVVGAPTVNQIDVACGA